MGYIASQHEINREVIKRLLDAGIRPTAERPRRTGKLSGKTFVLTGALSIPRDVVAKQIATHGGQVTVEILHRSLNPARFGYLVGL